MRSNSLKADFACQPPGVLQGPLSIKCQHFRRWDLDPPVCLNPGCTKRANDGGDGENQAPQFPCTLPELSGRVQAFNGYRAVQSGDAVAPGESVRFHCTPVGVFMLMGETEVHCDKGAWSAQMPVCALDVRESSHFVYFVVWVQGEGGGREDAMRCGEDTEID